MAWTCVLGPSRAAAPGTVGEVMRKRLSGGLLEKSCLAILSISILVPEPPTCRLLAYA